MMIFLKNKAAWVLGILALAAGVFAFPKMDWAARRWLYVVGIVGAWVAWGLKKIPVRVAVVVSALAAVAWAIGYFMSGKSDSASATMANASRYPSWTGSDDKYWEAYRAAGGHPEK